MTIEPESFDPIRPGDQTDPLVARRLGSASWLTASPVAPPSLPAPSGKEEQPSSVKPRGIFVDFTGNEELLEEFIRESEKAGLDPAERS